MAAINNYTNWSTDNTTPFTWAGNFTVNPSVETPTSTITFDVDGGTPTNAPITQEEGTAVAEPADPTKDGYTFQGWVPAVPATMPVDDVTCVAQWASVKSDQTIDFPAIGDKIATDVVGLAATATSGLAVSFAVGSGPATISGGTNLSFSGAGSVSIVASQGGDANWNPAPDVTNTFNVLFGNHAPAGADNTVATLEDTPYPFTEADFGFTDPNDSPPNNFLAVKITTLPVAGTLSSGGIAVTNGQTGLLSPAGATWTARGSNRNWNSVASSADGTKLVAGEFGGRIYTSTDSGTNWTARGSSRNWFAMASSADGTKLVAGEYGGRIYTSTDSGTNWTARGINHIWPSVASSADGTKLVAGEYGGRIYTSTDSGTNWTARESDRDWWSVASSADGTKLVAAVWGGPIYTSTDSGMNWTAREITHIWTSVASSADGTKLVAAMLNGPIYTSTDSGANWSARASAPIWSSLASSADGSKLVAVVQNGQIYTSTDSGTNWTARASNRNWRSVASSADGRMMVAAEDGGQIYTSQGGLDLIFTPAANGYGGPYSSFTFQMQDDGGTANGGADLDPTPKTLTINVTSVPDDQTITFPAIGDQVATDVVGLAATASSGLGVSFSVGSGPATISGGTNLSFSGTGSVAIVASQAGDADWNAAPDATNTFNVAKAAATVFLQNLAQTYDGTARTITATTMPAGLTVEFTYDGGGTAPTDAGTYAVTGTVDDAMCQGFAADALVVGKADQTIFFAPIDPQKRSASLGLSATASSGQEVLFNANPPGSIAGGTNLTFTGVGDVSVVASQAGNGNYNAAPGVTNVVKVFSVTPDNGPLVGGITVAVSNGVFGTITNVLVDGTGAPFAQGGLNWFTVALPAVSTAGAVDFVVQTSDRGDITLANAYGYHPAGRIGIREEDWTQWEEVAGLPAPRAGLAAGTWEGRLYAIGGWDGVHHDTTNMFVFDGAGWQEMAGLPTQRYYTAVGTLGGALHVVGGWRGGGVTNVYRYDGASWSNVAGLPVTRSYHGVGIWGDELYAIGGVSGPSAQSNVFRYNGTNWSVAPGIPGRRYGLAAGTLNGSLYAIGGLDETSIFRTNAYRYDGTNWQEVAGLPAPRFELAAATLGDSLYAIGGQESAGNNYRTNVYRYDGTNWQEVAGLPAPRYELAATTLDGAIYAVGGQYGTSSYATNTYRYPKLTLHPGVSPSSGVWTGGYAVVIAGTNLGDGADITNVTLCGVAATILPGQSATQVVVTAGMAGAAGLGDVRVFSTSYGETMKSNAFEYLRTDQAALVFAPASPQAYGTTNGLSTSDGSGTGAVGYAVSSGPGLIVGNTNLAITASSGDVVVVATKAQDDLYFVISTTATVAAAMADQTIDFPAIGDKLTTDAVGLAATASSGLAVSFAVGSGPATIAGGTNLSFTGAGSVSIVASQGGDANWNAAPDATNTFNVLFVNHAPAGADHTVATLEDTPYAFTEADFGFTDPDDTPPNNFMAVKITTLPGAGTLSSGGLAVTNGQPGLLSPAGATWTARESSRPWRAVASSADGTKLVAGEYGGQLYTSTDSGATWTARESSRDWMSVASSADGTKLVAGGWGGQIYTSTDSGANWTARAITHVWSSVASSADGTKLVAAMLNGQIYTSTDSGTNWTARESDRAWWSVASSADGTKLVAGEWGGKIYTSTDSGTNWTARDITHIWTSVASSADGTKLVAAMLNGPIYTSTDSGANWTARASGHMWSSLASSADGSKLVAVVQNGQIYTSTDSGTNWTARASNRNWRSVASSADGNKLFAAEDGGQIHTSQGALDLTFTPAANGYGSPYSSFTFQMQDDGGTATGGADLDPTPKTLTINVTSVPDDQTITFPAMGDQVATDAVGLAATASSGLGVSFAVGSGPASIAGGTNLTFSGTGSVSIVASQAGDADWNAAPDVTNTFNVAKAAATVFLQNLAQTYSGAARTVTATTMPAGLTVEFTYDGNATAPTDAGTYAVTGTINDVMCHGSAADTLVIGKAAAAVTLGSLAHTYDGTPKNATATTVPAGLTVDFTYDGSATAPTAAGSYAVTGTVDDVNYQGSAADTLVVARAFDAIVFGDTNQIYDGTARAVTAVSGSGAPVAVTYAGSATVPVAAGAYAVTGVVAAANWEATNTTTLTVAKADQTIANFLPADGERFDLREMAVVSATASSGGAVDFANRTPAIATLVGTDLTFIKPGLAQVEASQAGDANWNPVSLVHGWRVLNSQNALCDFDGDGKADLAVYHAAAGNWYIKESTTGNRRVVQWGWPAGLPVPGDYDGDGQTDIAVYHPASGNWFMACSSAGARQAQWGWGSAAPVPGDYDGDGTTDIAVYDPILLNWHLRMSLAGDQTVAWGLSNSVPVPADYDGDGVTDLATYRPATGTWSIRYRHPAKYPGDRTVQWGWSEAVPVPGDYDGDGAADIAVFHRATGNWYLLCSTAGIRIEAWGWAGTTPVAADYDGDGATDIPVYHQPAGNWYVLESESGLSAGAVSFGWSAARPVLLQPLIHSWFGLP